MGALAYEECPGHLVKTIALHTADGDAGRRCGKEVVVAGQLLLATRGARLHDLICSLFASRMVGLAMELFLHPAVPASATTTVCLR